MSGIRLLVNVIAALAWLHFSTALASADVEYLQSLHSTDYHYIESDTIGRGFHIYVRVPPGYADSNERYPTAYILDGGNLFTLFAGYSSYLRSADDAPEFILVGISYGANTFEGGNLRSTDFTAPSDERDYYGGAVHFQSFLSETVIPKIETEYRSRNDRRIVFGQSLGGQFVLYTAQTDPDLFWGHIASNPALHRNLDFFLTTVPPGSTDSRVFVAGAEFDDERYKVPRKAWTQHWTEKERTPWKLKVVELPGHSHMSPAPASFRLGLRWLFDRESPGGTPD